MYTFVFICTVCLKTRVPQMWVSKSVPGFLLEASPETEYMGSLGSKFSVRVTVGTESFNLEVRVGWALALHAA